MIIDVAFEQTQAILDVAFEQMQTVLDVDFGEVIEVAPADIPTYEGPYAVAPSFAEQTLKTAKHMMQADVNVDPISIARVSNNAGGMTVIIGG